MALNNFYASMVERAVLEEAEALRSQLKAERDSVLRENDALLAELERVEQATMAKADAALGTESQKNAVRHMEEIQG
jgi:hypothetical protein